MDTIKTIIDLFCQIDWKLVFTVGLALLGFRLAIIRVRKNVLSNQKLRRVEELRDTISSFLASIDQYMTTHTNLSNISFIEAKKNLGVPDANKNDSYKYDFMSHGYLPYLKASGEFIKYCSKITFALDEKEKYQKPFLTLMKTYKEQFDVAEKKVNDISSKNFKTFCDNNNEDLRVKAKELLNKEEKLVQEILKIKFFG